MQLDSYSTSRELFTVPFFILKGAKCKKVVHLPINETNNMLYLHIEMSFVI